MKSIDKMKECIGILSGYCNHHDIVNDNQRIIRIFQLFFWFGEVFAKPTGVRSLATAVSSTQINLSWSDNSSNETGFTIERKTPTGAVFPGDTVVFKMRRQS